MSLCLKRKSIRKFKNTPVPNTLIDTLLTSAMQAPSARNQQPWEFIVIKNKEILTKLSKVSTGARHLEHAPLGILTVMRNETPASHMRPQDMAAATQNILLEATNQGLGSLWIGVYPLEERLDKIKTIISVPDHLTPFSMIAIGYPDQETEVTNLRFDKSRVMVIE